MNLANDIAVTHVPGNSPQPKFKPAYLNLAETGELSHRAQVAAKQLGSCTLCGWNCEIDRSRELGPCRTGVDVLVSTSYIHMGEESPLVGETGSGAIFFTNCDLRCQFCQTYRWNIKGNGTPVTIDQLGELMVSLQDRGALNVNLVTPTHVLPQILSALLIAVSRGLAIPLVWNSGGYDSTAALDLLDGVVDIFLPDMKYSDSRLAARLSGINDYAEINQRAVKRMHELTGDLVIYEDGVSPHGTLVRHLVMPGMIENTRGVLEWIAANLGAGTYVSLMDQYRPAYRAVNRNDINRGVTSDEFAEAKSIALGLGLNRLDQSHTLSRESG